MSGSRDRRRPGVRGFRWQPAPPTEEPRLDHGYMAKHLMSCRRGGTPPTPETAWPSHSSQIVDTPAIIARSVMTPAPCRSDRRLRVGAEQRWFHTVGLGEGLADGVEQTGVRRGLLRREPRSRPDRSTPPRPAPPPNRRSANSARSRHACQHHQYASDVNVHVLQIVRARPRTSNCPTAARNVA